MSLNISASDKKNRRLNIAKCHFYKKILALNPIKYLGKVVRFVI